MKNKKNQILLFSMIVLLLMSACLFNVARNEDGTLRVETTLSAELIQSTLLAAANLPENTNVQVELMDGYVQVHSDQLEVEGQTFTDINFRLYMSASGGKLQAKISDASYSGTLIPDDSLSAINEQISEALATNMEGVENASLDSVQVTPDGVVMVWRLNPGGN